MNKKFLLFNLIFSFVVFNFTFASQSSGTIDPTFHFAKVCHDATCSTNGNINFLPTTGTGIVPITVDDTNGIDGTAWGSELGWITFGRVGTTSVTFSDTTTGSTTGFAWSQVSGWINMSPTGYGVKINSNGEFQGWAWSGGPMGGWIKFDCASGSGYCVKTDWRPTTARTTTPSSSGGGGGGGGGFVVPPIATSTPVNVGDDTKYKTEAGEQSQKTDYTSEFRADIDDSGLVDIFDYNQVMVAWGKTSHVDLTLPKADRCAKTLAADVNCDGGVDALDFNLVMVYWGQYIGQQGIDLKAKTLKEINHLLQLH